MLGIFRGQQGGQSSWSKEGREVNEGRGRRGEYIEGVLGPDEDIAFDSKPNVGMIGSGETRKEAVGQSFIL